MIARIAGVLMGMSLIGCASMEIADSGGPTVFPEGAYPIVSGFGAANNPNGSARPKPHGGVDILAPIGTPVYAAEYGVAYEVTMGDRVAGNVVHQNTTGTGGKLQLRYAHLDEILVREGDKIVAGQMIGTVGKTGEWVSVNEAPHLHFAVLEPARRRDPEVFLRGVGDAVECVDPDEKYGAERFGEIRAGRRVGALLLYPVGCAD